MLIMLTAYTSVKSKVVPLDQPADDALDMLSMELNIDSSDEMAIAVEHDTSYENLIAASEPPSSVLPTDVDQIDADKITMSEIGDKLDSLKDDNVPPLPDISGSKPSRRRGKSYRRPILSSICHSDRS